MRPRCLKDIYKCSCPSCQEDRRKIDHRHRTQEDFKGVPAGARQFRARGELWFMIEEDGEMRRI